jgi:cation:H+ antiporter
MLFTNAVEILGGRLKLGPVTIGRRSRDCGTVGTTFPETMIPLVAILAASSGEGAETAGEIGAILGAPFLLATLAMFVSGAVAVFYRGRREQGMEIRCRAAGVGDRFSWCKTPGKDVIVDQKTIARDVGFSLIFFTVAAPAGILELPLFMRIGLAALLIFAYYVHRTL